MKFSFFEAVPLVIGIIAIILDMRLHNNFNEFKETRIRNSTKKYAFATVTTPAFCMGTIALAQSLKNHHGDKYDYVCLITKDVNSTWRRILSQWWIVEEVPEIMPHSWCRRSWIKLNLWKLTEYEKVVYFDSDMLCYGNVDALFDEPELSCVADVKPPQICNTGVLVIKPNVDTFNDMMRKASRPLYLPTQGDQGFINQYFGHFNPLPPEYNVPRIGGTGFGTFFRQNKIKMVHFVCKKPWKCGREGVSYCGCGYPELNDEWYRIFDEACKGRECIESWKE